jgi:hypothetical protein
VISMCALVMYKAPHESMGVACSPYMTGLAAERLRLTLQSQHPSCFYLVTSRSISAGRTQVMLCSLRQYVREGGTGS